LTDDETIFSAKLARETHVADRGLSRLVSDKKKCRLDSGALESGAAAGGADAGSIVAFCVLRREVQEKNGTSAEGRAQRVMPDFFLYVA